MSVSQIKAGGAVVEISADDSKLVRGLNQAKSKMSAWAPSVSGILKTAGVAATAAGAGLALLVKGAADTASNFQDLADKTGISAKSISTLSYAAGQTGTDLGGLQSAMKNIAKELDAGGKSFAKYGIDVDKLRSLSPEDQFKTVAEAVSRITDPTARAAAALDMLGKSGQDLIPLLSGGAAGLDNLQREAERLGLAMSNADAAAGEKFGDSLSTLGSQVVAVGTKIGSFLIPHMQPLIDKTIEIAAEFLHWMDTARPMFDEFAAFVSERVGRIVDAFRAVVGYLSGGDIVGAVNTVGQLFVVNLLEEMHLFVVAFQQLWQTSFVQYVAESINDVMKMAAKASAMVRILSGDVAGGMMAAGQAENMKFDAQNFGAAAVAGSKQILEQAKADFAKLLAGGGVKPKGNDLKGEPDTARRLRLANIDPAKAAVQTDPAKLNLASVGTFNARAAGGLAGNTDTAAIRVATQATARNTARLAAGGGAAQVAFGA